MNKKNLQIMSLICVTILFISITWYIVTIEIENNESDYYLSSEIRQTNGYTVLDVVYNNGTGVHITFVATNLTDYDDVFEINNVSYYVNNSNEYINNLSVIKSTIADIEYHNTDRIRVNSSYGFLVEGFWEITISDEQIDELNEAVINSDFSNYDEEYYKIGHLYQITMPEYQKQVYVGPENSDVNNIPVPDGFWQIQGIIMDIFYS